MAFNVNHGLVIREFEPVSPNGEVLSVQGRPANLGFCRWEAASLAPKHVSSSRSYEADDGTVFRYVSVNDEYIRIDKAETSVAVVAFPPSIEGLPVLALGPEVLAENETVEAIECPPNLREIGSCAFRLCTGLRRIVLPAAMDSYSASWLQHCDRLEELVLPGGLSKLTRAVFDHPALRILVLGPAVAEVEPGACEKTTLDCLQLDPSNPFIETDGVALYRKQDGCLLALARPVERYEVRSGCPSVARKAAKGHRRLKSVVFPDSLEAIEPYAFAHCGLESVSFPSSLKRLGERSFFHCEALVSADLNEGLGSIGDAVFAESGLRSLRIPSSVDSIGSSVFENSAVAARGPEATFEVSPASPYFLFDGEGGLYRRQGDGLHFVQLVDPEVARYEVIDGTVAIDPYSFAFHRSIEEVVLPEGVAVIGDSAFRICGRLRSVVLPSSLRSIGKEAFLDTVLESLALPAALEEMGADALVTAGAHHGAEPRTLRSLAVHGDNPCFYVESGILCQRGEYGDRALAFDDATADVVMPEAVESIAPYVFSNAENIRSLVLGPRLKTIAACGFTTWSIIEELDITLAQPEEGRTRFVLRFPAIERTRHELAISLGGSSWVNVPEIYRHYDNCIGNGRDYGSGEGMSPHDQVVRIIERLRDPVFLTPVSRSLLERVVRLNFPEICRDIARCDDRSAFTDLADLGFLDAGNIEEAILAVQPLQDAAMTGFLLELKRLRFAGAAFDFDL